MSNSVVLFLPSLGGGGAEHFMVRLANGLAERGVKVNLLVANAVGPNLTRVSSAVNIVDFKCQRIYKVLPKLINFLRKNEYKVFLSTLDHANIIAIIAHIFLNKKIKLFIRQATVLKLGKQHRNSFKSRIVIWLLTRLSRRTNSVIVTSKVMKIEFLHESKISHDKVIIIPNPVELKEVKLLSKEPIIHPWFLKNQLPIVIAVGRLESVKGFDKLILAFSKLLKKTPARLVILGEGSLREQLEKKISDLGIDDHVWMPGFVDNIYPYLSSSKIFALTSQYEGFPNGMLEAMACGANIVAFNCPGGVSEILENGRWGCLVPQGDVIGLSQFMFSTLRDLSENKELPDVILRAHDFSIDIIIDKYMKIFFQE